MRSTFYSVVSFVSLALGSCGGGQGGVADGTDSASPSGLRRIALTREDGGAEAPRVELAGHIEPAEGLDTWEIEATSWEFEGGGVRKRPLRMTGPGLKRIVIPGPFSLDDFDRISVMVANPAHGSMRATLALGGGAEVSAQSDVLKGRVKHPATLKLPRPIRATEVVESLTLELEIKRAVTVHGIDFIRQPLLATLPSPETGAGLVNAGLEAHRAYGLGLGQALESSFQVTEETGLFYRAALLTPDSKEGTKLAVRVTPTGGEAMQGTWTESTTTLVAQHWGGAVLYFDVPGTYDLRIELQGGPKGTVAAVAEPHLIATFPGVTAAPPTVMVVTSDTHRADHLGATSRDGAQPLDTPNLDAFAASGILFESAWTSSNTTIPSHSALLTGRHPRDTKVYGNYSSLGADPIAGPRTLAEAFAKAGYGTVAVLSSSHLSHQYSGLGRGFDVVVRPGGSEARASESIEALLTKLNGRDGSALGSAPVFVWLHLFDAHGPYLPPPAFDRRYYPKDKNPFDPALPEIDLQGGKMPLWLRGLRDRAFPRAQYRAEIAYLDSAVGELLAHPRVASGITAFTSDHGEVFERNGVFYEHKGLTPDTLRVPLILRAPGLGRAGERVPSPVRQMDVGRTLLNLGGLESTEFPGRDLTRLKDTGDEPTFAVSRRFASATQGKWHGILTLQDLSASKDGTWAARHQLELYDIEADLGCATDLAAREVETAARLRSSIVQWLGAADPTLRASRPNLDRAAKMNLAALGYASSGGPAEGSLFDEACMCNECLKFK